MSYISGTTTRLSGLASSIDTDMVVEELMKASEIKVDEVRQQKQILEWKQEFYQEVTKKLYDFQQKYFSDASWS
ncbi:MAG: flagellar cap protein FliD N-terminal domain-containing protein, partial [Eubacteriales bacterium]|nr:flagellar cap protein FliD N-terminal domain-containing protein [Eubacteriales bacterium]